MKRRKKRRPKKKHFSLTINITTKDIIAIVLLFFFIALVRPPNIAELGVSGTFFVLYIYLFHSTIFVLTLVFIWNKFLKDYVKLRQLRLDYKEFILRGRKR